MEIVFTPQAKKDLEYWKKTGNKIIQNKISRMMVEISENSNSLEEIGKPEKLKYNLSGCLSKRINDEHRLVYTIINEEIRILSLRFHY